MERLVSFNTLIVTQKKEWGEILSGFEARNKYLVTDTNGNAIYAAGERKGSFLLRILLKSRRPFEMDLMSTTGSIILSLSRPFRFYNHMIQISDARGRFLGSIERQFSLLKRIYSVLDSIGKEQYELYGPLIHPWTFEIRKNDAVQGKITKKWGGVFKEGFTDADTFSITFPMNCSIEQKALLLCAVLLIDFVHFEHRN
jgi:uncharacterized protein YxjI